ncbi:HD domain-containing protein [Clostridium estertheticum]|uniref:HD domain-containing protein n=1 Tax=Clostridium estertheticum TaxID=238834 RepID=UPI0013E943F3|nr:HD domain-containing protein [Clostridium estertheticum]MBZ9688340.1 HD domain-containing protein [Clostridium estertheticum]
MNDKINLIIENHSFQYNLRKIESLEKQRRFCLHDMQHLLDVARIMYIISLENNFNIPKYMIYAAALLHDIGRGEEYENMIPHNIASVRIAKDILEQCEYDMQEIDDILDAIGDHRNNNEKLNNLSYILYSSDKLSRNCAKCSAIYDCKWPVEKKNMKITY